jgi:hydrogenase nickel incorporation protein HypA/HybF
VHEFSIADALAGQVIRHAPPGKVVSVAMRIGALRGLEPEAMRMCWEAVTHDTRIAGAELEIESLPWTIVCAECGRTWTSPQPFVTCDCGNEAPVPTGGDELDLMSISVEAADDPAGAAEEAP